MHFSTGLRINQPFYEWLMRFVATKSSPSFLFAVPQQRTTVAPLPNWIDRRLTRNLDNRLSQEHVVETIIEADRPFFSIRQLQARLKPEVSKATVRNRLNELQEIDVVATETYPESVTLYYINHPESNWPLSPEGKRALTAESPLDRLSTRGFLTLRDTVGVRTLILAGFQLSLVLFALGGFLTVLGISPDVGSDIVLWGTAFDVLGLSLLLLIAERIVSRLRTRYGPLSLLPTA